MADSSGILERSFRREYATLVARLSRAYGFHLTERVEDAVQSALEAALHTWKKRGIPDDASAWLYTAARNRLIDDLRRRDSNTDDLHDTASGDTSPPHFEHEIADDELRMLFTCADPAIPVESQLVLALKILCGFGTREIALRLFTSEENVLKRLSRARERLRELELAVDDPPIAERRDAVLRMVYLLFNEGYASIAGDRLIRRELCDEAIRLGHLLVEHPVCAAPTCDALLALMYLHAARFDAREDGEGGVVLLDEQDRSRWDRDLIQRGLAFLARSARGSLFSRYHAEAAVAVEHCTAPSYAETRWEEIVDLYALLERQDPSPLHTLNRAIALAEWQGPAAGLAVLDAISPPAWLAGYYLWDATVGELARRAGDLPRARRHLERAIAAAPHPAEKVLLRRKLADM